MQWVGFLRLPETGHIRYRYFNRTVRSRYSNRAVNDSFDTGYEVILMWCISDTSIVSSGEQPFLVGVDPIFWSSP